MKKKKKTTTTRPSRLGGQSVPIVQESAGILNYFDINKNKKASEKKEDVIMVLDDSDEPTLGKTDTTGEHLEGKNVEARVQNHKENINDAENKRSKRVQSEHHENMLLVEEYGQCCSQDILLGNAGGKVVWNASPRSGFLSTEKKKRFSTSPSPRGERDSAGRRKKIEPVILPQESMGDDVDGVLDALSVALANSKRQRRESTDGLVATPKGSVALGALRQCCSALQSKLSNSCKKIKNASRRSSLSCDVEKTKEIKIEPEEKCIEKSAQGDVICWDDSDDDVDLSNVLVALDNAASEKEAGMHDEKNLSCPLVRCDSCTVISCSTDSAGVVVVLRKQDGSRIHAHLTSPWDIGDYRQGDPVNLVNVREYCVGIDKHCNLGGLDNSGFLIHHPEILLGGTRVTSSSECPRRGYLSERMTGEGPAMEAAVKGIMFHQLLQQSLMLNFRRSAQLKSIIEEIVASMPEQLLDSELSAEDASKWLLASIPSTLSFLNRFLRQEPGTSNTCNLNSNGFDDQKIESCLSGVADIEEYFVSPTYGLKGFVDSSVSFKSKVSNQMGNFKMSEPVTIDSVGPLEIKTGKPRHTDAAQVLLYLLALEERYGSNVPYGMLYYKLESMPTMVRRDDNLISCLLATRNTVAASIARVELPPLTSMKSSCIYCYERSACALVHASRSKGTTSEYLDGLPESSSTYQKLKASYELETRHLSDSDKNFLTEWDYLLDIEFRANNAKRYETWSSPGHERERLGKCVTDLVLQNVAVADWVTKGNNGFNRKGRLYTFVKGRERKIVGNAFSLGEPVLMSIDNGPVGVSRGHVHMINSNEITIHTDKPIRKKIVDFKSPEVDRGKQLVDLNLSWRIDKEEVGTTVPRMRSFLFDLFSNMENPHLNQRRQRLRQLIIELKNPQMGKDLSVSEKDIVERQVANFNLNNDQEEAVKQALVQPDYSLVLGVPGAGKTTAVLAMIRALEMAGKRVLLVSYTNSAVDHVMLKLASQGFDNFLRLGRPSRVNSRLEEFLPMGKRYQADTAEELQALMERIPVVGVSALGVTDALLRRCDFDVCIIDEAGQITLPAIIGPILKADKFILVGDHHQLPPLVQSPEAEEKGLGTPLFARLANAHPNRVITLARQYRMSEEIQSISNTFVYGGALSCGTIEVAKSRLSMKFDDLQGMEHQWLCKAICPEKPVCFIDTSKESSAFEEISKGDIVENHGEADLAIKLAETALAANVPGESVAIISPYRSQVALINEKIRDNNIDVECLTIDKAQGRDKAMVIVSLVRSNASKAPGKLLNDIRRVNVAVTRAQSKLILLGDSETLKKLDLFDRIIHYFSKMNWIMHVDPKVISMPLSMNPA